MKYNKQLVFGANSVEEVFSCPLLPEFELAKLEKFLIYD